MRFHINRCFSFCLNSFCSFLSAVLRFPSAELRLFIECTLGRKSIERPNLLGQFPRFDWCPTIPMRNQIKFLAHASRGPITRLEEALPLSSSCVRKAASREQFLKGSSEMDVMILFQFSCPGPAEADALLCWLHSLSGGGGAAAGIINVAGQVE
jgi:hypothetical protein